MKSLYNKNILITGAASGLGKLLAIHFARERSNLILIDINRDLLVRTEQELSGYKVKTRAYVCDISSKREVDKTAKLIRSDFDRVDVLINNAGIVNGKAVLDLTFEEIRKTMEINFLGPVLFIKHFLPDMVQSNNGHIVTIASTAGLQGMPKMSDYCASKFADIGFTDSLRLELKKYGHTGIKTTCVCPYVIDTGMFKGFRPSIICKALQPEYVAVKVLEAVKKDKPYVILPFSMHFLKWIKLLPTGAADWIVKAMGGDRAMDTFTGRK